MSTKETLHEILTKNSPNMERKIEVVTSKFNKKKMLKSGNLRNQQKETKNNQGFCCPYPIPFGYVSKKDDFVKVTEIKMMLSKTEKINYFLSN